MVSWCKNIQEISDILKQNTKEADISGKEIEPEKTRKGGDAEKEEFPEIENPEAENKPAQTDIAHMEKQPAQNEKREQPEQAR